MRQIRRSMEVLRTLIRPRGIVAEMSLWTDLGFRENPYSANQLPATEEGERLLVGRDSELRKLKRVLTSSSGHATVEGDNGVGKSSLVAVAGFQLFRSFRAGHSQEPLIPLPQNFQLTTSTSSEEFDQKVLYEVAQAFIDHRDQLAAAGVTVPDTSAISSWLNRAKTGRSYGVSGPIGGSYGEGAPNTSVGFADSGLRKEILGWLTAAFPTVQSGGFLCVIDNLELLDTSQAARAQLEELRDSSLDWPGLRWILCGARGIVRSAAASPRLSGKLAEPIEVGPIEDRYIADVIDRRLEHFGMSDNPLVPVDGRGFTHIYHVLNRNLRDAFQHAERFALWMDAQDEAPSDPDERFKLLEVWLTTQAEAGKTAATGVTPRQWEVFDLLEDRGGSCSPSDYEDFGFESSQALRPHIRRLEEANLVISKYTDEDVRRKTITITPNGWLVAYERRGYELPT